MADEGIIIDGAGLQEEAEVIAASKDIFTNPGVTMDNKTNIPVNGCMKRRYEEAKNAQSTLRDCIEKDSANIKSLGGEFISLDEKSAYETASAGASL